MKRSLNLAVSLAITALAGWFTFRTTKWGEMWDSLTSADYRWVIPYLVVLAIVHLSRALRWRALLSGLEKVSFSTINQASAVGFMMLVVLPFRLGEFARPFLIARRSGIRRSAAMTSVVLERITDGILVAVGMRAVLFFVPPDAPNLGLIRFAANVMFAIFFGGLVFLLFALWQQARAVRLVRATVGRLSPRLADVAAHVVNTFVGALRQLPDGRQILVFIFFTATYWLANGAGMALLGLAFAGTGPGDGFHLSLFQGYVVMCVLVVGVMIPGAPGNALTFQFAVKYGLLLFLPAAVVDSAGLAYANVLWLCQTMQQIGLGLKIGRAHV